MEEQKSKTEPPGEPGKEVISLPVRKKRSRLKLLVIGLAVLILLGAGVFYYFLFIAPYESTDDAFIDGYVTLVAPRVAGQITQLLVTDNQQVKEGDVLVTIDPRDFEVIVAQAKADLATARSRLDESKAQVDVSIAR